MSLQDAARPILCPHAQRNRKYIKRETAVMVHDTSLNIIVPSKVQIQNKHVAESKHETQSVKLEQK